MVSRGGRPDLAGSHELSQVHASTLLLVDSHDEEVLELNRTAYARLQCDKELGVIAGASHLLEQADTLEQMARQTAAWFSRHLKVAPAARTRP